MNAAAPRASRRSWRRSSAQSRRRSRRSGCRPIEIPAGGGSIERSFSVRRRDLDPLDHVNNAVYLDYFDETVVALGTLAHLDRLPRIYRLESRNSAGADERLTAHAVQHRVEPGDTVAVGFGLRSAVGGELSQRPSGSRTRRMTPCVSAGPVAATRRRPRRSRLRQPTDHLKRHRRLVLESHRATGPPGARRSEWNGVPLGRHERLTNDLWNFRVALHRLVGVDRATRPRETPPEGNE